MSGFLLQKASAPTIVFKAFLASDHISNATGKTIAITISKNGGAFGNPNAGATNATEISAGFYKVALDATDTGTAGHLAIKGTEGTIDDVALVYLVTDPTVAFLGANAVQINAVSASSVTTINANIGSTQPLNFTGTGASALVKGDTVDIAGAAVSTSTAQIGVNVVNFGGSAGTFSSGRPEVNTTHAAGTAWGSGAITAASIATDAIGAAELAADAVTEIAAAISIPSASTVAAAVWDMDATAHQTQGTFGQAIGDPVADTNTIFKAVVTDATGATVGIDAAAILDDTGTSGVVVASINNNAITAAAIATDAIGSAELAASAVSEIQSGLSTLDAAGVRSAVGLASANLDTQLDALPTAVENADALLNRDMSTGTDSGSTTVRTVRQALRFLRNKWTISGSTLTVFKEDDSTTSWGSTLTSTPSADPITESDPGGP